MSTRTMQVVLYRRQVTVVDVEVPCAMGNRAAKESALTEALRHAGSRTLDGWEVDGSIEVGEVYELDEPAVAPV